VKIKKLIIPALICCLLFSCNQPSFEIIKPGSLRCEYLENPMGVDTQHPRFTWKLDLLRQGIDQRAYQLFIGTDSAEVASGKGNTWESGKVRSSVIPAVYSGSELKPFIRYYWSVRVQDELGKWSAPAPVAFFETGMMDPCNWKGSWITDTHDYDVKPAPYFRKSFSVAKKVKSARIYIAVGGLYELSVNGKQTGNQRLDPMYTRYDRRTLYVTHDVTHNILDEENVIGVLLGNGWFNHQSTAVWEFHRAPWRARPKFCLDLRISYEDGSDEIISTGNDWKTVLSPVIFNSIFTAEHYDARLEIPGWDTPAFNDEIWKKALCTGAPSVNIVSQVLHPIRNVKELQTAEMRQTDKQTWLYDFGRNISGVTKISVEGLDHFEAEHEGPYGKIHSSWERSGEKVLYKITIPANSTASLFINAREILEIKEDITLKSNNISEKGERKDFMIKLTSGNHKFLISG